MESSFKRAPGTGYFPNLGFVKQLAWVSPGSQHPREIWTKPVSLTSFCKCRTATKRKRLEISYEIAVEAAVLILLPKLREMHQEINN